MSFDLVTYNHLLILLPQFPIINKNTKNNLENCMHLLRRKLIHVNKSAETFFLFLIFFAYEATNKEKLDDEEPFK
jgi:hypothetical protein